MTISGIDPWRVLNDTQDELTATLRLLTAERAKSAELRAALSAMVAALDAGNDDAMSSGDYIRQVKAAEKLARDALATKGQADG